MTLYRNRKNYSKPKPSTKKASITRVKTKKLEEKLATAVSIHTNVNARNSVTVLSDINDYANPQLDNRETVVTLARRLRRVEGICASVADLLADFAITKGYFYSDNDELKVLLNSWANFVNSSPNLKKEKEIVFPVPGLRTVARKIFDDYLTDGDSVFTLFWKNNVKMKTDGDGYFLPVSIKTLDVLNLSIDEDLAKLGIERIELKFSDQVIKRIKTPTNPTDKFLRDSLPKEWLKFINTSKPIILDPNVTFHIKRNGKDYRAWGESLFIKAFASVANKRRIQAVDDATIDGLINRFTIFKVGLPDKDKNTAYHIPSTARVSALVDILQNAKRANAAVWPGPDLEILDIGPDGKILEFDQKYKQADVDILRALHVPPALIDGTSGGSTQAMKDWVTFVSTEVGLDAVRNELERIFAQIGQDIAVANNLQFEELTYKFDTQLLKNESQIRNFALKVYELGGMSVETFVKTMGYDFSAEKNLKEKEQGDGTKDLFVNPNVPGFTGINPGGQGPINPDGGEGRPADTPSTEAAFDSIKQYKQLYSSVFSKILDEVENWNNLSPENNIFMEMSLTSGFAQFERLVNIQLSSTYRKFSGGNTGKDLDILLAWNSKYIKSFYNQLLEKIQESYSSFIDYLDNNVHRLDMYAKESFSKAMWLGKITTARLQRKEIGTWKCKNEDSPCIKNHNKEFSLDFLAENFPGHPNCICEIDFGE